MKRALISVSDKSHLIELVECLVQEGYDILSTGGTSQYIEKHGFKTIQVSDYTGFPEMLDGRVKTLHPKIHAGLLAKRDDQSHMEHLIKHHIDLIDIVVVNLYPFVETINKKNSTKPMAIEQIDIGGPSMLRSAAKNMDFVTVLCDPNDYKKVINEIKHLKDTSIETKHHLAQKVFKLTANYDMAIANYLSGKPSLVLNYQLYDELRYGENPHQRGFLYQKDEDPYALFQADILHGKKLSYNNILDANAAINILAEFNEPCAVAIKHTNPCGVGVDQTIEKAFDKAYFSDETSIFGGIVSLNRNVEVHLAAKLHDIFLEIIIAPSYDDEALLLLKKKKNLRILKLDTTAKSTSNQTMTSINGGLLIQDVDQVKLSKDDLVLKTTHQANDDIIEELLFAYHVCKHVKSNAIVLSKNKQTIGIGAGQMNRIGSANIALQWAKSKGHVEGIVLASDAFFPFNDLVDLASKYGVIAMIQPGGSLRDQDSIDLCNQLGIPMYFTNIRHFKH